jgi:RNA polymerase sigma-70 factor (ECF subfamily)
MNLTLGAGMIRTMDSDETDAEALARSREQPEAFALVFEAHFAAVHRYLERRVGRERAGNLAAEVFRIAFQRRDAFVPDHTTARPWLFGIATNLVMKDRRRERRRLRAMARLDARPIERGDAHLRVEEALDAQSLWKRLGPALAALNDRDRDVVLLIAWEGLSYEAVASALAIPLGTVRSRLHRARRQLRDVLGTGEHESLTLDHHDRGGAK